MGLNCKKHIALHLLLTLIFCQGMCPSSALEADLIETAEEAATDKAFQKLAESYLENLTLISAQAGDSEQLPLQEVTPVGQSRFAPLLNGPRPACQADEPVYTINFEDISVIQLLQFISKIAGTNFIFDNTDLQFTITILSEEATSVTDLFAALMQILKMHNLSVVEQGKNVLIYKNPSLSKISKVITDANVGEACGVPIITRVFSLPFIDSQRIGEIVKTLVTEQANVEVSEATGHLIVTDITANIQKIEELLKALQNDLTISEYTVLNGPVDALARYGQQILTPFLKENFALTAEPASRKVFIVGTQAFVAQARELLSQLDVADIELPPPEPIVGMPGIPMAHNNFEMYKLKYKTGEEIAFAIREIGANLQFAGFASPEFVSALNSVQWLSVNNSIVIAGTDVGIAKVVDLLKELDQPPKQVFIEVLIIDTTLSNSLDFGVQWIALGDEQNKLAYGSGLLSNPVAGTTGLNPAWNLQGTTSTAPGGRFVAANPSDNPPAIPNPGRDVALPVPGQLVGIVDPAATSAFGLGVIGNILRHNGRSFLTLGALVSALDEDANTTIVLNPRVLVEDTQTAVFFVGQNIPYQTTSTVVQQTGSVTQNIQYEDIGVELRVTPTVASDNTVSLRIDQSISDLASGQAVSTLTPTTNKTLATTRVHVPDGTFFVMSGHIRDRLDCIHSGIPCLGTLPLIGPAFSRTIDQRSKRNLIFFVRPKVVVTCADGVALTNDEGYEYNWESNPCSLIEFGPERAPECEVCPIPPPVAPLKVIEAGAAH